MDKPLLPTKGVIASQYVLYFGILGIFLPYFNLYCFHLGFSGFEIGVISAVRTVTTAFFPLVWGALADRYQIRKPLYVACSIASTGIWALFLLTTDFLPMLAITLCYGTFYAPIIAFLEAFTMDHLGTKKKRYGAIRAWGSISFILTVILVGRVIDAAPIRIILVLILAGSILQSFLSTQVPGPTGLRTKTAASGFSLLTRRPVLLFLCSAFLMLVSHGTYYGFFSIHLAGLGYGGTFIGFAWALASAAEILVMINSERIFMRFSLQRVLVFSFLVAAFRWSVLSWAESGTIILLTQLLHAATYGAFHMASILYIDSLIPAPAKTFGQSANNAVTYGLGMMTGFFLNGVLYDWVGVQTLFGLSAVTAIAGAGLLLVGSSFSSSGSASIQAGKSSR
ncbi:Probable 3-phenylpropionic acid transporter [Olavius algarvensis associated proteobacterium Delta 3]|nr:Probable 3-phenylpropionic acid transporter [Olavius algarvensis associated proteobacterium Delta 3]